MRARWCVALSLTASLLIGCGSTPERKTAPPPPCDGFSLPSREAKSPLAVQPTPELESTRRVLERTVRRYTRDPGNPWAVGHGLIALGRDLELSNGRNAVDWLFETYAEEVEVLGETRVRFPSRRGDVRIEPHTDLLLKAFAEVGVSPAREVQVEGRSHKVADLICHSMWRAWVEPDAVGFVSWNDTPWALQGLATYLPEDREWTSKDNHAMSLSRFADGVIGVHHDEVAFIRDAMARGVTFEKRKQGIFGYTCGGAHLVQGAGYAAARGYGSPAARQAVSADLGTWFARYAVEMRMVDKAIEQHPEYRLKLMNQRLKFLGHLIETAHKLAAVGMLEADDAQRRILTSALDELVRTVAALEEGGVLTRLEEVRAVDEQTYLDFVGDAAHALRGLDLATGRAVFRY